jgi:hypothetical protein
MKFSVTKKKEKYMMSMEKKDYKEEERMEMIFFQLCLGEEWEEDNNKVLKKVNLCSTQLK